jgi:nucleotide-binding universal stress UspA family protein
VISVTTGRTVSTVKDGTARGADASPLLVTVTVQAAYVPSASVSNVTVLSQTMAVVQVVLVHPQAYEILQVSVELKVKSGVESEVFVGTGVTTVRVGVVAQVIRTREPSIQRSIGIFV